MNSRERLLAAIDLKEPAKIPCSFMLFKGLWAQSKDYLDFIQRQVALGLDAYVQIPPRQPGLSNDHYNLHGLPLNYDPSVRIEEWVETPDGEQTPILVKEYHTPARCLRAEVRQTDDWPYGEHVPFLDDYLVGRSRKFIVDSPQDLEALKYLLVPPTNVEMDEFRVESELILAFAREYDLLVTGGWGVGADLIGWIYGLQRLPYAVFDDPDFIRELLGIIAEWNHTRMEVVLQAGVDLYIKRAWYENCDYFTPRHFRQFIRPILEAEIELAHSYGAQFGYIMTSNCMPLLDDFREVGVDVLIGVDPAQWDLEVVKEKLSGRVCLWGGVNGHMTVELGNQEQVRSEVQRALQIFGESGGFILSPVDNVREYTAKAKGNVSALIDEWQHYPGWRSFSARGQPVRHLARRRHADDQRQPRLYL